MTPTSTAEKRTSPVRLLLLAGAVAGLFAMHGLGDHGTAHHPGPVAAGSHHVGAAMPAGLADRLSGEQPVQLSSAAIGGMADSSTPARVLAPADSGSGLAGLCMAVLAGVLFALAGLRAWRRLPAALTLRLAAGLRLAAVARERDPPRLVQLSICRC